MVVAAPRLTPVDRLDAILSGALDWLEERDFVQWVGRLPNWAIWLGIIVETVVVTGAAVWWGRGT